MKAYPRRRDVRESLTSIYEMLGSAAYINDADEQDFDLDVLNDIRDLMRDGVHLGDALLAVATVDNDEEEPFEDLSDFWAEFGTPEEPEEADADVDDLLHSVVQYEHTVEEIKDALQSSPGYRYLIAFMIANELGAFTPQE